MSFSKNSIKVAVSIISLLVLFFVAALGYSYLSPARFGQDLALRNSTQYAAAYPIARQQVIQQENSEFHFWIGDVGPSGPIFSGPHQYPFICTAIKFDLGQAIIDTDNSGASSGSGPDSGLGSAKETEGTAVFPEILGYPLTLLPPVGRSKNCAIHTRVDYFYFSKQSNRFQPLSAPSDRPGDLAMIELNQKKLPFIVRMERGTINRFIYSIAMLAPYPEDLNTPKELDNSAWNGKLVYKFQGGIGVGHNQGVVSLNKKQALHYDALRRGFAVAYSTGTRTTTHYNLRLAEETAMMLKLHFEATYGSPKYTVGIGGSGGAIQQYIIAQNNPGIIDAAIAQASFPDMITQTIYIPDCELLERYFDDEYLHNKNSPWQSWRNRKFVEGGNVSETAVISRWQDSPAPKPGASECIGGWRGTMPLIFNPNWTHPAYFIALNLFRFTDSVIKKIKWTHWNDLANIYPMDSDGYSPNSWDNIGVQYGLQALNNGQLSIQEFLNLNACIGGWKHARNMVSSGYPWDKNGDPAHYDPWDSVNMNLSANCKQGKPAPRTQGNIKAMHAAYNSGHVFSGNINIPILDIRWYLEPILDMHHAVASFSVRARMNQFDGHANNHIIWVAECSKLDLTKLSSECQYNPTADALDVIDEWMKNIRRSPTNGTINNSKPKKAVDTCYQGDGSILYAGDDAWYGIIDTNNMGKCSVAFPVYSTSRMVAGASILANTFKCALKPMSIALTDGTYANIRFTPQQVARLEYVFSSGVCDYTKPDLGLPFIQNTN